MMLYDLLKRPAPYAPGPSIWTDAHISGEMLKSHLSDEDDAASYRTSRRERICAYLQGALGFAQTAKGTPPRLLDLGCGPGLYAQWFAQHGVDVTGVDFSAGSLAYARAQAETAGLSIRYVQADYRDLADLGSFHAAMMISEDFGVLDPAARHALLCKVHAMLLPGGRLAMDVSAAAVLAAMRERRTWFAADAGFFRPHPHVVLEETFVYPQEAASTDLYVILEDEGMTRFLTHQTHYTPERIEAELTAGGFAMERILGDLDGTAYTPDTRRIGVIAVKR